jgi:sugar phosphate isomerase/epimerase
MTGDAAPAKANHRLSVNSMCSYPWPFDQELALWTEARLQHAGLLMAKLGPDPDGSMVRLTAAGITASTLIIDSFDLATPETWDATAAAQRLAVDLMAKHGGHSIYFTPGRTTGAPWREDLARLADAVAPTVSYARMRGVLPAIEPSLRTSVSFVNTLRDGIDVAELTGLSLVADFGNMWMERDFREVLAQAMPHVALMQISDMVIGSVANPPPGGRAHIGEGELPLRRMMGDVLDAGYTGVFDLEVVPANFTQGSDRAALRRGIAVASAFLDDMGV